ncbi:MAG: hypothetical protein PHY04_02225 [Candidatus ainarchaeum sp.]|jgi:hypothetical protein|nr:hypothetical protein [Candidatus ainarchaeum sp.]MDD3085933.1 hypothetical protein [Candidatus ainarchaeum sp.]MDD4128530.1 hypothetical protein [Candidatus ainarchaeum sp.]MDD4467659.1 hypothetical protein [Candidatus ainarchaeum sp.]HPM85743.1 hypothetical protein [archaeon]
MAWGLEFLAYLDPFYWGAGGVIFNFFIWSAFAYLGSRGDASKPLEQAMQIIGYVFGLGLLMDFMMLPSMWVGVGMVLSYVYSTKYVLKWDWRRTFFILLIVLLSVGLAAFVSEPVRWVFLIIIMLGSFWVIGQSKFRSKKILAQEKSEK